MTLGLNNLDGSYIQLQQRAEKLCFSRGVVHTYAYERCPVPRLKEVSEWANCTWELGTYLSLSLERERQARSECLHPVDNPAYLSLSLLHPEYKNNTSPPTSLSHRLKLLLLFLCFSEHICSLTLRSSFKTRSTFQAHFSLSNRATLN